MPRTTAPAMANTSMGSAAALRDAIEPSDMEPAGVLERLPNTCTKSKCAVALNRPGRAAPNLPIAAHRARLVAVPRVVQQAGGGAPLPICENTGTELHDESK